jgi:hypothetical protein
LIRAAVGRHFLAAGFDEGKEKRWRSGCIVPARPLSTLKDGLIVEHRATRDDLRLSRRHGLLPPAPPWPPDEQRKRAWLLSVGGCGQP